MFADDAGVDAAEDFVQHVDAEYEVIEVSRRPNQRHGDGIEGNDVVRDGAAEEDIVLAVDARIGGEAPQEDEDVGDEQEKLRRLAEHLALAVDVTLDRAADAVVEAGGAV